MKKPNFAVAAFAFLVTVACAVACGWEASDLVWASWISSLCLGCVVFLVSIASVFRFKGQFKEERIGCAVNILVWFLPAWAFLYLVILPEVFRDLFPLGGKEFNLMVVLRTSLQLYWPFLLISFLPELVELSSYWKLAGRMSKGSSHPVLLWRPFAPLPRMLVFVYLVHCLLVAGMSGYGLYPALVFYFFPWGAVPWGDLFGPHLVRQRSSDPDRMVWRWGGGFFSVPGWALLLAGLYLVGVPLWGTQIRGGWDATILKNLLFYGLPFGAIGAVLALARFELTLDRRAGRYTWRHRFPKKWTKKGSLKAETITSVRITCEETAWRPVRPRPGNRLSLTGSRGPGKFYHVHLARRGEDFAVDTFFVSPQKAQDLAQELATFYDVPVVAGTPGTEGSSESGAPSPSARG